MGAPVAKHVHSGAEDRSIDDYLHCRSESIDVADNIVDSRARILALLGLRLEIMLEPLSYINTLVILQHIEDILGVRVVLHATDEHRDPALVRSHCKVDRCECATTAHK